MILLAVKTVHVLAAMFFLGAGLMTAYYKVRADRSGDLRVLVWYQREIVLADWLFTLPSGVVLPVTGIWLATSYGIPLTSSYVAAGIVGYAIAGALWVPAAWLQIRMRAIAATALRDGTELPPTFHKANRAWMALGVPAFAVAAFTVWVMVAKSTPW